MNRKENFLRTCGWLVLIMLLVGSVGATAQTLHVDRTNPNCPGSGSPSDPFCKIQDAIVAASDGTTVLVAPGTYRERIDFLGKAIEVRSLDGPGATTIDAQSQGRVVTFRNGEGRDSVLEGFTIRNGLLDQGATGAGILCLSASPTIRNNTIRGNRSHGSCGGFVCYEGKGGGVALLDSSALLFGNTIRGNVARFGASFVGYPSGGGVFVSVGAGDSPEIVSSVIDGNFAGEGGGVWISAGQDAHVTMTSTTVSANRLESPYGGFGLNGGAGVTAVLDDQARLEIRGSMIVDNEDARHGGGIAGYAKTSSRIEIVGCEIARNRADSGGGVSLAATPTSTAILANSTVTANTANGQGGGISGSISGAGVHVVNSILWGNSPDEVSDAANITYSDVQGGYPGVGNLSVDPLFVDAASGDTRLSCSSPCVDAGTSSPGVALPTFDRSGLDLRQIGSVDLGADELGTFWELQGVPNIGGPPVGFQAVAAANQNGNLSEVYVSLGPGAAGGLSVPGAGGRKLGLNADAILGIWLSLPSSLRQVSLSGCTGVSTVPLSIPANVPVGLTVNFAGVTWSLPAGAVTSISGTESFVTQ